MPAISRTHDKGAPGQGRDASSDLLVGRILEDLALTRRINAYLSAQTDPGVRVSANADPTDGQSGQNPGTDALESTGTGNRRNGDAGRYLSRRITRRRLDKLIGSDLRAEMNSGIGGKRQIRGFKAGLVCSVWREDGILHVFCRSAAGAQRVRLEAQTLEEMSGCQNVCTYTRPDISTLRRNHDPEPDLPAPPPDLEPALRSLATRLRHPRSVRAVVALAETIGRATVRMI